MMQAENRPKKRHSFKILKIISILALLVSIALLIYDALYGGLILDKGFGAGSYYYTDVPGWQKIFVDSPYVGFKHPVIAMSFFIIWAALMFKLLYWLDKKL